jgi:hypothetical protein
MAKLPSLKRIQSEDFPGQASWIGKLLYPLNVFMESISAALSNGLTVGENFDGQVKTVTVSEVPVEWRWERKSKPLGLWTVSVVDKDGVAIPLCAPTWEFTSAGTVKVTALSGITPTSSNYYTVTFVVITG